jgi:hypothetical protein
VMPRLLGLPQNIENFNSSRRPQSMAKKYLNFDLEKKFHIKKKLMSTAY